MVDFSCQVKIILNFHLILTPWTITHNKEIGIYKQSGNYLKSRAGGTWGFRGIIATPTPFLVPTKAKPSCFKNELN